jgi:hypothetical protein
MEHETGFDLRRVGVPISACNLGEALGEASRILKVRFELHESQKWFRVFGIPEMGDGCRLADVHIKRDGEELCPKQDLSYAIYESDIVCIYTIIC